MLAVVGGHVDAVSLLLEREATVDMADHQGMTALHLGVSFLISDIFKSRICKDFSLILIKNANKMQYKICSLKCIQTFRAAA